MFIVAPYVSIFGGTTATRLPELFAINTATMVIIWTIVTLFLFVTLVLLYRRNPLTMSQQRREIFSSREVAMHTTDINLEHNSLLEAWNVKQDSDVLVNLEVEAVNDANHHTYYIGRQRRPLYISRSKSLDMKNFGTYGVIGLRTRTISGRVLPWRVEETYDTKYASGRRCKKGARYRACAERLHFHFLIEGSQAFPTVPRVSFRMVSWKPWPGNVNIPF
jgi:hypothetical protein